MKYELIQLELSYAELVAINKTIKGEELTKVEKLLIVELGDIIKGLLEDE